MADITMMWADRFSVGESRCYHSQSALHRSVAPRVARLACRRSRDTNSDVMVSRAAVGGVAASDVAVTVSWM